MFLRSMCAAGVVILVTCAGSLDVLADEPVVLKFASIAPDGSIMAQEIKRWGQDVESMTGGHVRIKWYLSGVAGDELEQGDRMMKGQLDGSAGGQMFCNRIIPSMRVTRRPGVFQSREEAADAINRLNATMAKEAHAHGFYLLTAVALGPDVIFSRTPVHDLAELRRLKLWRWDLDEVGIATSREMGLQVVPLPVADAARAYDNGRVDGFLAVPLAALAFQWSSRAHNITDLRGSYLWSCLVVTERSLQHLPTQYQDSLRVSAARARERFEEMGRRTDEELLGGLFAKQGARSVPVSSSFRAEYIAAARAARNKVADRFMPRELVDRVLQMLADYRIEHDQR
ncbi:MAG: TRAP-type C4-dicarboxylate transporter, periplasmic component [bacterium]|nr:TRAP-type C4-dicarboxylate transporter, periplasmic component [bacterium]